MCCTVGAGCNLFQGGGSCAHQVVRCGQACLIGMTRVTSRVPAKGIHIACVLIGLTTRSRANVGVAGGVNLYVD